MTQGKPTQTTQGKSHPTSLRHCPSCLIVGSLTLRSRALARLSPDVLARNAVRVLLLVYIYICGRSPAMPASLEASFLPNTALRFLGGE